MSDVVDKVTWILSSEGLTSPTHTQREKRAKQNLFIQGKKLSPKDSYKNADMHKKEP